MKLRLLYSALAMLAFTACKTYTIPVESFREQSKQMELSLFVDKWVRFGYVISGGRWLDHVNPVKKIKCVDKRNVPIELYNSPTIEMRVSLSNHERYIFYFDHVHVNDDTLFGAGARRMWSPMRYRKIPLSDIVKIEIQDNNKAYFYD